MYKALITFGGLVSMRKGETKEISDISIAKDLLRAGFIEEIKPAESPKAATSAKKPKKTTKK